MINRGELPHRSKPFTHQATYGVVWLDIKPIAERWVLQIKSQSTPRFFPAIIKLTGRIDSTRYVH